MDDQTASTPDQGTNAASHEAQQHQGPRITGEEFRTLGQLRRSLHDRHVGGVAGGLARHFDIDPTVVRVVLAVLALFNGAGLILYVGLWLIVPEEGTDEAALSHDDRSRVFAIGGVAALTLLAATFWNDGFAWMLAIVAAIVGAVMWSGDQGRTLPGGPPPKWTDLPPAPAPRADGAAPTAAPMTTGAPLSTAQAPAAHETGESGESVTFDEEMNMTRPIQQMSEPAPVATEPPPPQWSPQARAAGSPGWSGWDAEAPTSQFPGMPGPPPGQYAAHIPPLPPNPRKRGPILFWFTLALVVLGTGVLGVVEGSGTAVADSAYPALALAITSLMLLVGAFWGRAGGLVLLGIVFALGLGAATAGEQVETVDTIITPTDASSVPASWETGVGAVTIDLTEVSDVEELAGRSLNLDVGLGQVIVRVPAELDVRVTADVGVGSSNLLGSESGGLGAQSSAGHQVGALDDLYLIDIQVGVGDVRVTQE